MSAAPVQADFAATLHRDWFAPRAAAFARDAAGLAPAIQALCDAAPDRSGVALDNARQGWTASLSSRETLAGVALGPVLERRSQRAIDFTPTRPRMIEKAIKSAPRTPAEMELVGTPAKGLPALEWLLWVKPVAPATPACTYAVQVALEVGREADALAGADPKAIEDATALAELINQWVGGIERLRWPGMEMPVRVAMTSAKDVAPDFPRVDSGAAAVAWAAQVHALRALALDGEASFRAALIARGKTAEAEALAMDIAATDAAMAGLTAADREAILTAAKRLAGLKHRVETETAPALAVVIGFSDADGD